MRPPSPAPPPAPTALGLALLSGFLLALSLPRIGLWPLAWLSFPPLLAALKGRSLWGGLWVGLVAGTTTCLVSMSWVAELLSRFADLPWYAAGLGWVTASLAQGLGLAAVGLVTCWLWRRGVRPIVALPAAVVAAELLVPMVFPWQVAVSQHQVLALVQLSELLGARGVSLVVALGGAAIFEAFAGPRDARTRRAVALAGGMVACALVYGMVRLPMVAARREAAPALVVGLIQPNISIEDKQDEALHDVNLALHQDMSAEAEADGAELIVWPESSYPHYVPREARGDAPGRRAVRQGFSAPVLFGALSVDQRRRRWNSAFLLNREGTLVGPADKNRLLLFAEHIPFYEDLEILQRAFPRVWAFTPGTEPGLLETGEIRAAVLNCYEDVLPDLVRQAARRRPNLLVNVTNDAWFGDTAEPHQHAALARFRAVEHRVDLVRATNSGVTTIVAATGEERARTPAFMRTTVVGTVRLLDAGTPYTFLGDGWAWCVVLAIPVVGIRAARRRKRGAQ